MKKFIKSVLLILCVSLVVDVILDCCVTRFLNNSQAYPYHVWNEIIHDTIDADLLIIGSSRARNHYDSRIMDSMLLLNTYNLGSNGTHIERQIDRCKVYRKYQKKKPLYIIFNIDYTGFKKHRIFERNQYFPYLTNLYMRQWLKKKEPFSMAELYIPMYRYYIQGMPSVIKGAKGTIRGCYKGFYNNDEVWCGPKRTKIKRFKFTPHQEAVEEFDVFLSELQQDSVKMIFVSSPIYIGKTEKIDNLHEFYDFLKYFSEKYDIPVLDYIQSPMSYDTILFRNLTHLNKTGAELFTTKLCHDLDSLGLLNL